MELILLEQRKNKRCHFCGTSLSVKYVIEIFDSVIDDCIANGGTFFHADIDADASCFYCIDDEND